MAEQHTFSFDDAAGADRGLLGGKGFGLVEMTGLGLPVPPGFVITTSCGNDYLADGQLPASLEGELRSQMAALEEVAGRRFGDDVRPLLVSVRSGAPVSMPGMMDTILNVGLTDGAARALAEETSSEMFAATSYERLLDGFARTVRGVSAGVIEDVFLDLDPDPDPLTSSARRREVLAGLISESGGPFPEASGQLRQSIEAVFRSWNSRRAKAYRKHHAIDDTMGTAVVVQLMVFGNRGDRSGSGVAFTRDPSTGAPGVFGEFLFDAQGEDVVSGERDALPLVDLRDRLPEVHADLEGTFARLERHVGDLCDIEFTIEEGRAWILQSRVGQRSGRAAVRIAVDLVNEGLISEEEAVQRVTAEQLEQARAAIFAAAPPDSDVLARGLAASPGAVVGRAVFDADRAQDLGDGGDGEDGPAIVLFRPTTSPADLPGVLSSVGLVTGRGGRTSHAAVVARGLGKAAVCGIGDLAVAKDRRSATIGGHTIREGDVVSVDGDRGIVAAGEQPMVEATTDDALATFESWLAAART